jgi:predicted enzyme related to lactoylglutathione lyase
MKRFHIHVGVEDLEKSVQFYSTLFGQKPSKLKNDYAWETYRTMGDAELFHGKSESTDSEVAACCVAEDSETSCCG